jgi:copper chaperone NosL
MTNAPNRRTLLAMGAMTALFARAASAEEKPTAPATPAAPPAAPQAEPWEWTAKNGPLRGLPKDPDPLTNEFEKQPRCRYCGMDRRKFSHTRHLVAYDDDGMDGTCSLRCLAIGLSLGINADIRGIWVGDYGSGEEVKPLVPVEKAFYVLDPSRPGTMTRISNFAYSDRAKADAAAATELAKTAGARVVRFDEALKNAHLVMAEDNITSRRWRAEIRKRAEQQKLEQQQKAP